MNKAIIFITVFFLACSASLKAQTDFSLSGLGRVIVTDDKLGGDLLKGDTITPSKGVGGYILFDLKPTLKVNNNLHANAILRVKNQFGSFFGLNTAFEFRQFQIMGNISSEIRYEIGDINIQMTPYTVNAFPEMYNQYEADIFKLRRNIVNYENFVIGNAWRLQGVQGFASFDFEKGIEDLDINAFAVRTNPTNDINIPDRILAGTRVLLKQSEYLSLGANYVGLQDISIATADVNYVNHVVTGDAKLTLNQSESPFALFFNTEGGFSNYNYTKVTINKSVSYNDYFYHLNLAALLKPAKLKLSAGFREVGPQFSSPSAQTRRINVNTTPQLFPTLVNNTLSRNQVLSDRFTQENIYNRGINPVLYSFLPQFNNITPYGDATPNRKGLSAAIQTDTSMKVMNAEVRVDKLTEIIGEGVKEIRSYLGVRGGLGFDISKLAKLKNNIFLTLGAKYEKTTRAGVAPIDFTSTLIDAGLTVEVVKKVDLMAGAKILNAKGTEYLAVRDEFNLLTSFPIYTVDITQAVYSFGARLRFAERSFFTVNYNISANNFKNVSQSYNINQFFFNYTIIIP